MKFIQTLKELPADVSNFLGWLRKVWDYACFLREDRDWEDSDILRLLGYKLSRVRRVITDDPYHGNKERYVKQIKTCEILINRLVADSYIDWKHDQLDAKWGRLEMVEGRRSAYGVEVSFQRSKCVTDEDKIIERKETKDSWEYEKQMRRQDMEFLCRILCKHHRNWWT